METIQFIPSTMACERLEKEKLRSDLDREIEAFLKRGGKIQKLKSGQSGYKNNIQPLRQAVYERAKATPDSVIEEKNKVIRDNRGDLAQKMADEIQPLLVEFYNGMSNADKSRFCKDCGLHTVTVLQAKNGRVVSAKTWKKIKDNMVGFVRTQPRVKTNDGVRLAALAVVKAEAISSGKNFFYFECAKHGKSKHKIYAKKKHRCVKCENDTNKKSRDSKKTLDEIENSERKKFNRDEMAKAVNSGLKSFTGRCNKHGLCVFRIAKSARSKVGNIHYQYKCAECKKEF